MHIRKTRIPFFRIFYSTTFTALALLLTALSLITPGDHIYQSFQVSELVHIFIAAGFYLLTFLVAIFLYAGRLYATRTALAGIPKELAVPQGGRVEREIEGGLDRSAAIAYEARPRDLRDEKAERHIHKKARIGRTPTGRQSVHSEGSMEPVWGKISHPGWSSPSSPDLPNLHFEPVILELSHLIEAKAVSLAPADPLYEAGEGVEQPVPDPVAVALLQRPASMGLRDYMAHLAELGMIEPITQSHGFLDLYERARFSGEELDETDFRALMNAFAEILRNLQPLATDIIDDLRATAEDEPRCSEKGDAEGDRESIQTSDTVQRTPQVGTCSSTSSSSLMSRNGSHDSVYTAPSRPGAGRNTSGTSRFTKTSDRQPSLSARGRMRSSTSSSGYSARSKAGSVIRLAEASGPLDLPYTFTTSSEE